MQNFSYVVEDESTHEAIVIDPSWDLDKIISIIDEQNLQPKYIVTLIGMMIIQEEMKN